jgi:hypothetical protein
MREKGKRGREEEGVTQRLFVLFKAGGPQLGKHKSRNLTPSPLIGRNQGLWAYVKWWTSVLEDLQQSHGFVTHSPE